MTTFLIGYVVLFVNEAILYGKTGYWGVSIRVMGVLFLLPMFDSKYIIKNKLEYIYKNVNSNFQG